MPFRLTPWNDKQKHSWTSQFLHLNKPLALSEDTIESDIRQEAEPLDKGLPKSIQFPNLLTSRVLVGCHDKMQNIIGN